MADPDRATGSSTNANPNGTVNGNPDPHGNGTTNPNANTPARPKHDAISSFFRSALLGAATAAAFEAASAAAHNDRSGVSPFDGLLTDDSHLFGGEKLGALGLIDGLKGLAPGSGATQGMTNMLGAIELISPTGPVIGNAALIENNFVDDFHLLLEDIAHQLGSPANELIHAVVNEGENLGLGNINEPDPANSGASDLLTEVLNAPHDILTGKPVDAALGEIVTELHETVSHLAGITNYVVDVVNLQNPLGLGLVQDITHQLGQGTLLNLGEQGGLVSAVVKPVFGQDAIINLDFLGDSGPSTSSYLIDLDVGKIASNPLVLDLLGGRDTAPDHQLEVNILEVGADGLRLLDADVLTNTAELAGLIPGAGTGGLLPIGDHLFG